METDINKQKVNLFINEIIQKWFTNSEWISNTENVESEQNELQ